MKQCTLDGRLVADVKPYICHLCDEGYKTSQALGSHMRNKHPDACRAPQFERPGGAFQLLEDTRGDDSDQLGQISPPPVLEHDSDSVEVIEPPPAQGKVTNLGHPKLTKGAAKRPRLSPRRALADSPALSLFLILVALTRDRAR